MSTSKFNSMKIAIEQLELKELQAFLREQADDAFPDLMDEKRLAMLSQKWCSYAKFCTCRDNNEGRLVGMIAFYANQPDVGIAYIPHVYICRKLRGKGLFAEMMSKVKTYLYEIKYNEVMLEVKTNNLIAQRAYSKEGFRPVPDNLGGAESIHMSLRIS